MGDNNVVPFPGAVRSLNAPDKPQDFDNLAYPTPRDELMAKAIVEAMNLTGAEVTYCLCAFCKAEAQTKCTHSNCDLYDGD